MPKINLDADPQHADWTKMNVDLVDIETQNDLKEFLKDHDMTIDEFKKLPIYKMRQDYFDNLPVCETSAKRDIFKNWIKR